MRCPLAVAALFAFSTTALTHAGDWPHFLGPNYNAHTPETGLTKTFPETPLWEIKKGKGHPSPVITHGILVFIHERDSKEIIQGHNAETGEKLWDVTYPIQIDQNFGISDAPRASPTIDIETKTAYALGVDRDLHALNLETGEIIWKKNLGDEFGDAPFFFGQGGSPLVFGDQLIIVPGSPGATVASLDKKTGEIKWKSAHEWNGSYASPIPMKINGQDRIMVFAGGMTKPPHGGLLCVNPADGKIDSAFPWRSDQFASVNAASPVDCGDNRVLITEDYGKGGCMLQYDTNFQPRILWQREELNCQFQTPLYHEGFIYAFGGSGGQLICFEVNTGRPMWGDMFIRQTIPWKGRDLAINFGKGNLMHADGNFICLGENGTLAWLDLGPGGATVLATAQPFYQPESWALPVLSNGKLYVTQSYGEDRRILCFNLQSAQGNPDGNAAPAP